MPNRALLLVFAAVLLAREMPSRYSSSRRGRHVATSVCHAVSLVTETLDVMVTVPVLLSWRRFGVTPLASHRMWSSVLEVPDRYRCLVLAPPERPLSRSAMV